MSPEGQPLAAETLAEVVGALEAVPAEFDVVASWGAEPEERFAQAGATWLVESRWPTGTWLDELEERAHNGPQR